MGDYSSIREKVAKNRRERYRIPGISDWYRLDPANQTPEQLRKIRMLLYETAQVVQENLADVGVQGLIKKLERTTRQLQKQSDLANRITQYLSRTTGLDSEREPQKKAAKLLNRLGRKIKNNQQTYDDLRHRLVDRLGGEEGNSTTEDVRLKAEESAVRRKLREQAEDSVLVGVDMVKEPVLRDVPLPQIYRELEKVATDFSIKVGKLDGQLVWWVRMDNVVHYSPERDEDVDLGNHTMTVYWASLVSGCRSDGWYSSLRFETDEHAECFRDNSYWHPNIHRDGRLCFGDNRSLAATLLRRGAFHRMFTLTEQIVRTYGADSPYTTYAIREEDAVDRELNCTICGLHLYDEDIHEELSHTNCSNCGVTLCDECCTTCGDCLLSACRTCRANRPCVDCGECYCASCGIARRSHNAAHGPERQRPTLQACPQCQEIRCSVCWDQDLETDDDIPGDRLAEDFCSQVCLEDWITANAPIVSPAPAPTPLYDSREATPVPHHAISATSGWPAPSVVYETVLTQARLDQLLGPMTQPLGPPEAAAVESATSPDNPVIPPDQGSLRVLLGLPPE